MGAANSQFWGIFFSGFVSGGFVSLSADSGGMLFNLSGPLSTSIGANLDGIFTGDNAQWFVGGFNLIDLLDDSNRVQGLYSIER